MQRIRSKESEAKSPMQRIRRKESDIESDAKSSALNWSLVIRIVTWRREESLLLQRASEYDLLSLGIIVGYFKEFILRGR